MPSNASQFPRLAPLVAGLLFVAACVDLTRPWQLNARDGAAGAGGGPATGGTTSTTGGAGGARDGAAGGTGGAPDAAVDLALGGAGGGTAGSGGQGGTRPIDAGTGGMGSGGAGGGIDVGLDVRADGATGGTGGGLDVGADGTGGADGPVDGARDRAEVDAPDAPLDLPPDRGLDTPPDTPPDLAVDTVDAIALPPGLVAYYPCENATAGTLPDRSGSGNDATLSVGLPADGGPAPSGPGWSFSAGKVGNALTLIRTGNGYVSMPPAIFNGATAITVAAWVKLNTAQNWQRVFDVGVNSHLDANPATGSKYFNLVPQNGSSQLELAISTNGYNNQQTLLGTSITPASGWRHVAVTLDGSRGILFVDSVAVSTNTSLTLRPADLGTIDYAYLGKSPWGVDPHFDGQLDEVRVYRRALSATEVQTLYQLTTP